MFNSNIRVVKKIGKKPGKTVVVMAGVHGDEVCNVRAFDELLPGLKIDCGIAYFIYANKKAIKKSVRFVESNLNRNFVEKLDKGTKKTLEGKTSREIIKYLKKADFLLDLHSTKNGHSKVFAICSKENIEYSKYFPSKYVVIDWGKYLRGVSYKYMDSLGGIGFTFEAGNSRDEKSVKKSREAILNFLKFTGLILKKPRVYKKINHFGVKGVYKNEKGPFVRSKYFKDFEILKKKTLIGYDGDLPVYGKKNEILVFVEDRDKIGMNCFFIAKKV